MPDQSQSNTVLKQQSENKQIISGALHYFRVHPGLWLDRLEKARAMGLNCIETYLPWNLHEPHKGEFNFSGICDVEKFVQLAGECGLDVILRPGPYICAEWENGGFPAWLTGTLGIKLRCMNETYLAAVEEYFSVLFPKLVPLLATNGGPVIMMQIENEYGSYGNDHEYMRFMRDLYRKLDIDVPLFTSDGYSSLCTAGGAVEGAFLTANFGTRQEQAFAAVRKIRPDEPDFCMEFWDGWFDHWGEKHHHRPAADGGLNFASEFEEIIARKASINLYMFHGGTNFGFTNGANGNDFDDYAPIVTSYDYDCPLTEWGDPGEKFYQSQKILKKYTGNPAIREAAPVHKIAPAPAELRETAPLRENSSLLAVRSGSAVTPPTMDELGENFGFILYRTKLDAIDHETRLILHGIGDRAQIWLDGVYLGNRYRKEGKNNPLTLPPTSKDSVLEILAENCGRINYGPYVGLDAKGLTGPVCRGFQQQFHWEYDLLPLEGNFELPYSSLQNLDSPAAFYRGTFTVNEIGEAFLNRPGVKGCVWINGFNIGRYWEIGPTQTLYIPSTVLKTGENSIVVLELEKLYASSLTFASEHDLGELEEL